MTTMTQMTQTEIEQLEEKKAVLSTELNEM